MIMLEIKRVEGRRKRKRVGQVTEGDVTGG